MPDDPLPPIHGDAGDESTASDEAAPGPTREAYDIPEWVSEIRRLYVEPKTRAKLRDDGEPPRHRRLSGIRPLRRTATAAPDPAVRPTAESSPRAAPDEPEHISPERLAAAMGISIPPPLTPALPTSPPPESPAPAVATGPATTNAAVAGVATPATSSGDVAAPTAASTPASTPISTPAPAESAAEVAVRGEPGTTHTVDTGSIRHGGDAVAAETTGSVGAAAPSAGPATNGSSESSLSGPWIPPTWTSPSSSSGRARVTGSADGQPDPAPPIETGSALARFADSAEARRAQPDPEAQDPVIEPAAPSALSTTSGAAPPVVVTAVNSEPVAVQVVEPTPVEVVPVVEPTPVEVGVARAAVVVPPAEVVETAEVVPPLAPWVVQDRPVEPVEVVEPAAPVPVIEPAQAADLPSVVVPEPVEPVAARATVVVPPAEVVETAEVVPAFAPWVVQDGPVEPVEPVEVVEPAAPVPVVEPAQAADLPSVVVLEPVEPLAARATAVVPPAEVVETAEVVSPVAAMVAQDAPVVVVEPVTAPEAPPPDAGPGRPSTVPAVHLSWREADSLHLGVPSVDDSFDAIVLEPPSQLVAAPRRRPQRRRSEDAEDAAIWAPVAEADKGEIPSGDAAGDPATRAVDRDAPARRVRLGRGLAVAALILVLLVVGWLVLVGGGFDSASTGTRSATTVMASASAAGPWASLT